MKRNYSAIVEAVEALTGVSREDMFAKFRDCGEIQGARDFLAAALHRHGLSYPQIGKFMGGKSHSGMHSGHARFKKRRDAKQLMRLLDKRTGLIAVDEAEWASSLASVIDRVEAIEDNLERRLERIEELLLKRGAA